MKILKNVLIAIFALVVIVLIIAAVLPKTFHAGSELIINRSSNEVFDYVKQIKKQGEYDNWSRQDPNIQKNIAVKMELLALRTHGKVIKSVMESK
jgi:predicted PurR-regulated permease PerM